MCAVSGEVREVVIVGVLGQSQMASRRLVLVGFEGIQVIKGGALRNRSGFAGKLGIQKCVGHMQWLRD